MKRIILLMLTLTSLVYACKKETKVDPEPLIRNSIRISNTTDPVPLSIQLDLSYSESGSVLSMVAYLIGPYYGSGSYTVKFTVPGSAQPVFVPVNGGYASYSTSVIVTPSPNAPTILSVSAQLLGGGLTSLASASQQIKILGGSNAGSPPSDPNVTVTLVPPAFPGDFYELKVNNIAYLEAGAGSRKLYFYAFYVPSENEYLYDNIDFTFLGKVMIQKTSMFAAEGSLSFMLPNNAYDYNKIRVMITNTVYPDHYFSMPLNMPGPVHRPIYLMEHCVQDDQMYGTSLQGLHTNNSGEFNIWQSQPASKTITINSMQEMMQMKIYYHKGFGYLQ